MWPNGYPSLCGATRARQDENERFASVPKGRISEFVLLSDEFLIL